jgi:hypothetical protein
MNAFKKALTGPLLNLSASHFLRPLNETLSSQKGTAVHNNNNNNNNSSKSVMSDKTNAKYKQLTCYMCKDRKTTTYCNCSKIGYDKGVTLCKACFPRHILLHSYQLYIDKLVEYNGK